MESVKVACVVMMMSIMVGMGPIGEAEAAITCGSVLSNLAPCLGYIQRGGSIPPGCCAGVKALNNAARSTPDRQAACGCIKSIASNARADPKLVNAIPAACGVNLPYKYSPSLDCSKVK